jgi:hypothetical protein
MGMSNVAGDENDRNPKRLPRSICMHIQPTHPPKVAHLRPGNSDTLGAASQEILWRGKRLGVQTYSLQQTLRRCTHTSIIINNKHRSIICGGHACAAFFWGSVN